MNKLYIIAFITCLTITSWAGPLNISKERYIENQQIEVLMNADGTGTIIVRPNDCISCSPRSYLFDKSLRVLFNKQRYSISTLKRWYIFKGDVVVSKKDEKLVAVKRVK